MSEDSQLPPPAQDSLSMHNPYNIFHQENLNINFMHNFNPAFPACTLYPSTTTLDVAAKPPINTMSISLSSNPEKVTSALELTQHNSIQKKFLNPFMSLSFGREDDVNMVAPLPSAFTPPAAQSLGNTYNRPDQARSNNVHLIQTMHINDVNSNRSFHDGSHGVINSPTKEMSVNDILDWLKEPVF